MPSAAFYVRCLYRASQAARVGGGAAMVLVAASCVPGARQEFARLPPPPVALSPAAALVPISPAAAAAHNAAVPIQAEAGPAAAAFRLAGSTIDEQRSLRCLTEAIYYEAASEADEGQRAVAQVVLNRVRHTAYPSSVCGVVYQGSERTSGCQFTFTCDGALGRPPSTSGWLRARRIAADALAGQVYSPVGLATHYHTTQVLPVWAPRLAKVAVIGAHIFYRMPGAPGTPAAFAQAYRGGEPMPIRAAPKLEAVALPAAAFVEALLPPPAAIPALALVPTPAADPLPHSRVREAYARSGQIRPEYSGSGRAAPASPAGESVR